MQVRKQFFSLWRNHYNVLSVTLYSIILIVVEEIMEIEFKCPQKKALQKFYVASYFFCPAFITFFLSLTSHPACIPWARCIGKCSCCRKSEIIFKALLPPLIWCVILLCDGRYIDCVFSTNEGNDNKNANQSRAAELPSEFYIMSQIAGLFILAFVVTLYGLYHVYPFWFCCNYEGHEREELESLLEEETRKHIEEMKKEGAEQIMEQKVKPSLQCVNTNFWKNVDLRKIAKKIQEVVESAVRDTWAARQQTDEQSVPLTSRVDMTTAELTLSSNTLC
ncbi:uncharacterized protein LOC129198824 [Grus americana]|uniref:uncharacterized protein LOC129198822 n=1 Tax=Grus americana TaxID=9117 RepID=UPI00240841C9|nr:uncharacterized protein LOC129198822 [Grus americana]XP_054664422.1 uncharacterized protein LOC129198823 [Grus americana]XP_054664423.1 uncharacterized protein LOC129198824 [Grus americana]